MSDEGPRHTPQPHDLFMALWNQRMFQEGTTKPGQSGWGPKELLRWGQVWADVCALAEKLEELETKATEAATAPETWPPETFPAGGRS